MVSELNFRSKRKLVDMVEGNVSFISFGNDIFEMNDEDGSITLTIEDKKTTIIPENESKGVMELVDEILDKYNKLK